MATSTLTPPRTRASALGRTVPPHHLRSGAPTVEIVGRTSPRPGAVEHVLDTATPDDAALALAAARADVVRLVPSAALPTPGHVRALVRRVEQEVAALGRPRADVRVVLEVETVVAADAADARRRRSHLAYAEAFAGLTWSPSASWVVAPLDAVLDTATDLARRSGVDAVALSLVGASAAHAPTLVAAVA
ncbi:LLM class flavin-dependent oxidoreductase [Cellulomonas sp. SLBN-39]|uniref:LLM class flavin-dependent oxidoreductase n=1 Tax=Cellulomonas sp. SLBN-39 TaxID=2768446 RepID=UPI0011684BD9|nr:LLM class flavin-dependent oxidoreductase [Cellulomonas sp. SLBN-39]TQL03023.1 luciferase-like monooxygenase [Cellulomonas sp. SLBN-39]